MLRPGGAVHPSRRRRRESSGGHRSEALPSYRGDDQTGLVYGNFSSRLAAYVDVFMVASATNLAQVGANRVAAPFAIGFLVVPNRSEEHTSEVQLLMPNLYTVFCLKNKN